MNVVSQQNKDPLNVQGKQKPAQFDPSGARTELQGVAGASVPFARLQKTTNTFPWWEPLQDKQVFYISSICKHVNLTVKPGQKCIKAVMNITFLLQVWLAEQILIAQALQN